MTNSSPGFLKIFSPQSAPATPFCEDDVEHPWLEGLCGSFRAATGWSLQLAERPRTDPAFPVDAARQLVPEAPADAAADTPRASRQDASALAASLTEMLDGLQLAQHVVRLREAELATGIPVSRRADEERHLAARLESVLQAGAKTVGCEAAAVYLLDDATSELKLRASWGLPRRRFLDHARPLRGAVADLEALVGHAVVLNDCVNLPGWQIPEDFPSAVCLPISSPSVPLGTVWFYAREKREISDAQISVLEVVAGRLVADLERQVLLDESERWRGWEKQFGRAAQWLDNRLPTVAPLLDDWQIAGWSTLAGRIGGDFYDWMVLPTGELAACVGGARGDKLEAALSSAALQTAVKAHSSYAQTPKKLLARVNETLWSAWSGDQFGCLAFAAVTPESGRLGFSAAGHPGAILLGPERVRVLSDTMPVLGEQPDDQFPLETDQIKPGELLVLVGEALLGRADGQLPLVNETALAAELRRYAAETPCRLIDRARHFLNRQCPQWQQRDATLLILKRLPPRESRRRKERRGKPKST